MPPMGEDQPLLRIVILVVVVMPVVLLKQIRSKEPVQRPRVEPWWFHQKLRPFEGENEVERTSLEHILSGQALQKRNSQHGSLSARHHPGLIHFLSSSSRRPGSASLPGHQAATAAHSLTECLAQ